MNLGSERIEGCNRVLLIDFVMRYRLYDTSKLWICASDNNVEKEALCRVNSVLFQLNML